MTNHSEMIVSNIRAERARSGMRQEDVVTAMHALGYTTWHRQTLGKIERGERRVLADELFSLAEIMGVPVIKLFGQT